MQARLLINEIKCARGLGEAGQLRTDGMESQGKVLGQGQGSGRVGEGKGVWDHCSYLLRNQLVPLWEGDTPIISYQNRINDQTNI
jgi:hypothetical protein